MKCSSHEERYEPRLVTECLRRGEAAREARKRRILLTESLQEGEADSVGGERDDEALVRKRREVLDHGVSLVLRVVNHHV